VSILWLRAEKAYWLVFDQAECNQLVKNPCRIFVISDPPAMGQNIVRQPPTQLLCNLKAHRLRAFA